MPSQLSPPACNRYICTKSCRCSGSQALPLLLLAEPSRPFFGTGDSKEGGLFHTPLHEFFRRRLDGRKGTGGVGGCLAWVAWAAEAGAWASASSRGRALRTQRPASPWEDQAAQSHRARAEGRRRACCAALARPRRAPCTPHRSPPGEWMKVGWGWGGRLGLELGSASGLG